MARNTDMLKNHDPDAGLDQCSQGGGALQGLGLRKKP